LADLGHHRLHELDARRRQVLALLLDALIDRQQLPEAERGAHRAHARAGALGATHVIEQVIEQLDRWRLGVARLALFVEAADLPIPEAQQPFHRLPALEAALLQRLDHRADHPPQLEHRLAGGNLLELGRDGGEGLEVLLDALAADPADEPHLVARAHPPRPLLHRERRLAGRGGLRLRLLVGPEVQQQQRPLGQQRVTAHGSQVVQQRQQHQRQIAAPGEHALEIARQLHHGAHQRIETLRLALALGVGRQQVLGDVLHLLGEERRAVDLEQPQHALHLVQLLRAGLEQLRVVGLLDVALERAACLRQRGADFTTDETDCLGSDLRHAALSLSSHEPPSPEFCRSLPVFSVVRRRRPTAAVAPARSASRCTSSATTAKPRPASPAIEDWIEALSARMLVCSAMSLMSSTMLPISCELSPRRLMRLEVSWMVSRMVFMPSMVRRTASPPLCATSTEWRATSEARSALPDTSSTVLAMLAADSVAEAICFDCAPLARLKCCDSACVWRVALSSWMAEPLMALTRPRSASTA